MKKNNILIPVLFFMTAALLFCACSPAQKQFLDSDKTFADMDAYEQEDAYDYTFFFLPEPFNGIMPGYVGDTMPYYEDGTYYIYYLKEAGGSYNHSVYLAATKDFVTYTDYEDPILEANYEGGQDNIFSSILRMLPREILNIKKRSWPQKEARSPVSRRSPAGN